MALVIEQDYSIAQKIASLGIANKLLYAWVTKFKMKRSQMERELLKKVSAFFAREMK